MKVIHLSLITLLLSTVTLFGGVAFVLVQDFSQTVESQGQNDLRSQTARMAN